MKRIIAKGFTLIELAIVLTIVAFVIGGLAIPISKHLVDQQYADTQATIDKAVEAVVGFAILNRRLPCPDINTSVTATDNRDGIEDFAPASGGLITGCLNGASSGAINYSNSTDPYGASWGDLPWQSLGLSAPNNADAWSHRLRYAVYTPLVLQIPQTAALPSGVTSTCAGVGLSNLNCNTTTTVSSVNTTAMLDIRCANPLHPIVASPANPSPGCIALSTVTPAQPPYSVSTNAVFVIYSMGANGWGSTSINTAAVGKPFVTTLTPTIWDQWANGPELTAGTSVNSIASRRQFVVRPRTDTTSEAGEYDDVLSFVSSNTLAKKLLDAGVWP